MIQKLRFLSLITLLVIIVAACGQPAPQPAPSGGDQSPTEAPADTGETDATEAMTDTEDVEPAEPTGEEPAARAALPDLQGRTIVVGSDTTYPPMEYIDEETKEIVGFDVDMMREIATLINANVEFQTFPNFDAIFAALANKEFNVVVSSVSVTEERKQIIDFSDPYLSIGQVITVQVGNTTITSQDDLANADLVGVQGGTTGEEAAKKAGVPEENIKRYDTIDLAFQDLTIGAIDAVVADGPPSAEYTAQLSDQIMVIGDPFTTEEYAIALQQGDTELKEAINAALTEIKTNGTLQQLMEKWNLQDVATIPGAMPAESSDATSETPVEVPDLAGQKLVIGSDTTYPPMEYIDEETKEIVGFDVDMMKELAKRINAEVEFQTFPNFDAIFAALANKEFDLVVSSVSVTEERKQIIDFSDPYLSIGQVISVQADNTTIASADDLVNAELVGVQGGTTGEEAAKKAGVPEENIKRYDTIDLAFQDLAIGAVDAVIADGPPSARYTAQLSDQVKVVGEPFTTENYAIALQQEQPELKAAINAALQQMKADGTLQQLMEKWNLQDVATTP